MRDTREQGIQFGAYAAIDGAGNKSTHQIVPYDCEISRVAMNFGSTTDTDSTFDVLVNDLDVGIDLLVEDTQDSGVYYFDAKLFLAEGDVIQLQSNGELASNSANGAFVIKPI